MSDVSASETIVSSTEKTICNKVDSSAETAASRGRTKTGTNPPLKRPAVPKPKTRQQLPPRPPATQKSTAAPKQTITPKKNAPKKACSTPTSEDVTISDMTLDASCISIVNRLIGTRKI